MQRDEWYRWRWEFLRLNPQYREAYQKALELRKQAGEAYYEEEHTLQYEEIPAVDYRPGKARKIDNLVVYPYLHSQWGKQEKALCEEVGHYGFCMTDPSKSYHEIMKSRGMERAGFHPATWWEHFAEYSLDEATRRLTITIDLSRVNAVTDLCFELVKLVKLVLRDFLGGFGLKHRFGLHQEHRSSKQYATIIKEGARADKLETQNKSWPDIARELYPGSYRADPETAVKTVQRYCREYRHFVNGGYREITFP